MEDEFPSDGPGGTAIVAKGSEILYLGAAGLANLELNVPMRSDHVLRLGSITKQFTSICILKLMEEGKLALQDDLTKFLPDYPTNGKKITIEHLLTHTSGIQSYTNMPGFMENHIRTDMTPSELIDVFKNEPMEFDPGEKWNYNNSGYILLGAIIEEITGMTYAEYVDAQIFKPLGMHQSYYGSNAKLIPNRASGYSNGEDGLVNAAYMSMTLPYAAGSLISTVEDLFKWNSAVFGGKLVSKESLEKAHTPFILNDGSATNYGYGWLIEEFMGARNITHGGGIFGFLTQGIYLPDEEVYVAVFSNCNCKSPNSAANRMVALASGKSLEFEPMTLDPKKLSTYEGVFQIEDSEDKRAVFVEDGKLFTQRNEGQVFEIQPFSEDAFFYPHSRSKLIFERNQAGEIIRHSMIPITGSTSYAKKTNEKYHKTEFVDVAEEILKNYIGSYELAPNFILTIKMEQGKLIGQATGQGPIDMDAISENEFVNQQIGAKIVFEKADGPSPFLVLYQGGGEMKALRVK
jgi:CubicO group peptidase (beta-lactamase class C family)